MKIIGLDITITPYILHFALFQILGGMCFFSKKTHVWTFVFSLISYVALFLVLLSFLGNEFPNILYFSSNYVWAQIIMCFFGFMFTVFNGYSRESDLRNTLLMNFMMIPLLYLASAKDLITFYISVESVMLIDFVLLYLTATFEKTIVEYLNSSLLVSVLFLLGVIFAYASNQNLDIRDFPLNNEKLFHFGIILILVKVFYLSGLFPFHSWASPLYRISEKKAVPIHMIFSRCMMIFFIILFMQSLIAEASLQVQRSLLLFMGIISTSSALYFIWQAFRTKELFNKFIYAFLAQSGQFVLSIFFLQNEIHERELLCFLVTYFSAISGAFIILNFLQNQLQGAFYRNRFMSCMLIVFLASLAGFPLTGGFSTKYLLFVSYFKYDLGIYVISLLLITSLGFIVFGRMIRALFETTETVVSKPLPALSHQITLWFLGTLVLLAGVAPGLFIR